MISDDDENTLITKKLFQVYDQLQTTSANYQNLLESLIAIFQDLVLVLIVFISG